MNRTLRPLLAGCVVALCAAGCAHPKAGHGVRDAELRARSAERFDARPRTSFAPGADAARSERLELPAKPVGDSTDAHDVEVVSVLRAALRGNPNLARYADTVVIASQNGSVRLAGRVDSPEDARFLAETAMEIEGVDVVYADMVIAPAPSSSGS